MLRILHTSDLHGAFEPLFANEVEFDVWLDTGDFLPNYGRAAHTGHRIDAELERRHQQQWLEAADLPARLHAWLDGRPALLVPGNHDFISLVAALQAAGVEAQEITTAGIHVCGHTWAGFREVPWMAGEWVGERDNLATLVDAAFASHPDILATHAPPAGILDSPGCFGVPELTTALIGRDHHIRAHFFGHEHDDGGRWLQVGRTLCVNGAAALVVVTLK